jgi:hypothetical protein
MNNKSTNTLPKGQLVGVKLQMPKRNTSEEACFVALQSYSTQSKASDAVEAYGNKFVP